MKIFVLLYNDIIIKYCYLKVYLSYWIYDFKFVFVLLS